MILEWGAGLGPPRVLGSPGCPTAARAGGVAWQGPGHKWLGLEASLSLQATREEGLSPLLRAPVPAGEGAGGARCVWGS